MRAALWAIPLLAAAAWAGVTAPPDAELVRLRDFLEHLDLLESLEMLDKDPTLAAAVATTSPAPATRKEQRHAPKK